MSKFPTMLGNSSLSSQTIINLDSYFQHETNHRPTIAMMSALKDAAQVIEDMANDECEPSFFLSSVDPGVGKTSMLEQSLYSLLYSPKHKDVGVLVCVSRLEEITKIVSQSSLLDSMFSAFTSDINVNKLGRGMDEVDKARVLFTTQQMVSSRCDGKSFSDVSEFHYKGKPRAVRVWDEAMLPGETLTLNRSLLMELSMKWNYTYPDLGDLIEDLGNSLKDNSNGDLVSIPDLEGTIGATKEKLLEAIPTGIDNYDLLYHAATTLWLLSGKSVAVKKDRVQKKGYPQTILSYRDHLPEDLAPMLILDASGRVRKTYDLWEASDRNNLVQLRQARKTYKNLTIHLWKRGGGKSSFRNPASYDEILEGICATIDAKPDEDFLIVHHLTKKDRKNKDKALFNVPEAVSANISNKRTGSIQFTSWGKHKASNEWSHVPNVILAGTLFYPLSYYESLGRMASNIAPGMPFGREMYNETALGEHKDAILQAGCRAAIRCSVDGDCPPKSHLYIIASAGSGIPGALQDVFPKHAPKEWKPVKRKLSKKLTEAVEVLKDHFKRNPQAMIKFRFVRQSLNNMNNDNFSKRVRKNPDFQAVIAEMGVIEVGSDTSTRPVGFMLAAASYGFYPTT